MQHPDKEFFVENDRTFGLAYSGKCIIVIRRKVVKAFDSLCDAMMYAETNLDSVNHILADYTGQEPAILYR